MEHTERLAITPLQAADAGELFAALDDPRVGEFIGGPDVTTVEALRDRIERVAAGPPADRPDERWLNYVVRLRRDATVVGRLEATIHGDWAEVAYVFAPAHWGLGYATEGTRWLMDHLMTARQMTELWAAVHPHNERSTALVERLGFVVRAQPRRGLASYDDGDVAYQWPASDPPDHR